MKTRNLLAPLDSYVDKLTTDYALCSKYHFFSHNGIAHFLFRGLKTIQEHCHVAYQIEKHF